MATSDRRVKFPCGFRRSSLLHSPPVYRGGRGRASPCCGVADLLRGTCTMILANMPTPQLRRASTRHEGSAYLKEEARSGPHRWSHTCVTISREFESV